jgi:hypothetical protein
LPDVAILSATCLVVLSFNSSNVKLDAHARALSEDR